VYSVIAVALSIGQASSGSQEQQPSYELGTPGESGSEFLFGVFNAIATVCFAWGGHNVALVSCPICATVSCKHPLKLQALFAET
jgi:hypothetical protein